MPERDEAHALAERLALLKCGDVTTVEIERGETAIVRKTATAKIEAKDDDEGSVVVTVNTASIDRDGEIVLPSGADLKAFRKNPVVLWGHDHRLPPIAKAASPGWIKSDKDGITAKAIFADTAFAQEVKGLIRGGFVNATSVGFRPLEWREPTSDDLKKNPDWADASLVFTKWELLEFSFVAVPANPEALVTAIGKGLLSLETATGTFGMERDQYMMAIAVAASVPAGPSAPRRRAVSAGPTPERPRRKRRIVVPAASKPITAEDIINAVNGELDRMRGRV